MSVVRACAPPPSAVARVCHQQQVVNSSHHPRDEANLQGMYKVKHWQCGSFAQPGELSAILTNVVLFQTTYPKTANHTCTHSHMAATMPSTHQWTVECELSTQAASSQCPVLHTKCAQHDPKPGAMQSEPGVTAAAVCRNSCCMPHRNATPHANR
jgi:hypothetical protein